MPVTPRRVAFLHTSPVHVETFSRLLGAADPTIEISHAVDEALLADAQRVGADDPALVQRVHAAMAAAGSAGGAAAMVVCTCSTIGGAAERTPAGGAFAVARIDRAMADEAVQRGRRILVVAALRSTLAPTAALLRESAVALGREIELDELLVAEAWPHFERGDREAYVNAVVQALQAAAPQVDAIVLAQASMAPAAERLPGWPVLSSPALGVQRIVARLGGLATS